MARNQTDERTLSLEDRPTVAQVIVICKQIVREERWPNRLARSLGRFRRKDWRAAWFRTRMRIHRLRNTDPLNTLQREIDRVAGNVAQLNAHRPREKHVRGKVLLPRGVFITRTPNVPDSVDIVWPRGPIG